MTTHDCFITIGNSQPGWDIPAYLFDEQWLANYDMACDILSKSNFFERTGFDVVAAFLTVGSPFGVAGSIKLRLSKKDKTVFVTFFADRCQLPDNANESAWKAVMIRYLAMAIEKVCAHFRINPKGLERLHEFANKLAPGSEPLTNGLSIEDDLASEIEIFLPYMTTSADTAKKELIQFQEYADKLESYIEDLGLASIVAEESTKEAFIIAIQTLKVKDTIAAIRSCFAGQHVPSSSWMLVKSDGQENPIPLTGTSI